MRLSYPQKIAALLGAFKARDQIKKILIRNYWASKPVFPLNLPGVDVKYHTDDFFSTAFFYQQSAVVDYIYEPAVTHLLMGHLKDARCFADVGANLGYFTVLAAKLRPQIPVHAFELDGTLVPLIERNLRFNRISNATANNAAVGDSDGTVSFTPHPYSFLGNVTGLATDAFDVKHTAPTFGLDDYFRDKPANPTS